MHEPDDVDLPAELEQLFEVGRSEVASESEHAALRERLAPQLGGGGSGSPGGGGGAPAGTAVVVGLGGAALVAGLAVLLLWPSDPARTASHGTGDAVEAAAEPSPPSRAPSEVASAAELSPAEAAPAEAAPAEAAPAEAETLALDPMPAPPSERPAPARRAHSEAASAAEPRGLDETDGLDETELIDRAQRALLRSPEEALRWVAQHQRDHPSGLLAQERERIAIEALLRAGRAPAARRRGEAFLTRWPTSAHAPRVRGLIADAED